MIFSKQLRFLSVFIFFGSGLLGTAKAELVTFEFTGQTQATFDNMFFNDVGFEISVSIDNTATDQLIFQNQRGGFLGATTTVSFDFPDGSVIADVVDVVATNLTGITQDTFGNGANFLLVNSNNLFNPALRVNLASGSILDPLSINPFTDPVPTVTGFSNGGVAFELASGSVLTLNNISSLSAANGSIPASANVPEPTSFSMVGLGLLTVSLRRRRRKLTLKARAVSR